MLLDDFLPVYDVSDSVATVITADVSTTWEALMRVDLIEVGRQRRAVGMLAALRALRTWLGSARDVADAFCGELTLDQAEVVPCSNYVVPRSSPPVC
jgi:hypothetical protein